jgi:hypothetical protein
MTLEVVFRPAARDEFDEAAVWYEERRPGLGVAFVAEIDRVIDRRTSTASDRNSVPRTRLAHQIGHLGARFRDGRMGLLRTDADGNIIRT